MIDIQSESYSFVKNKRDKFRIEIRKSENKSLIESKRFKSINPDSLKDNINIMETQNLNLDQILFKLEETIINNDIDSCLKLLELLEYDEHAPSNMNLIRKLIKIMRNPCSPSKIINQIGHLFKEFSCGTDEEKKIYVDEGILITLFGILKCNSEISESLVKNVNFFFYLFLFI